MRPRSLFALVVIAAIFAGGLSRSVAWASELHPTEIVVWSCEGFYQEPPPDYAMSCDVHVDDLAAEGSWPYGDLLVNGTPVCQLQPLARATSACEYAFTATGGVPFEFTLEYDEFEPHAAASTVYSSTGPPFYDHPMLTFPPPVPPALATVPGGSAASAPTPPSIAKKPAKRTRDHLASFRFNGAGPFECELDQGAFHATGANFSRRVATGEHTLWVRAGGVTGGITAFHWLVLPRRRAG